MTKKVLIITYYWPPAGGPGVQRWLKFSKYLPDFGFDTYVYVPENPSYPIIDSSLLNEINPKVKIVKNKIWEPYQLAEKLNPKNKAYKNGQFDKKENQSFLSKISVFIRGNFFIPDARKFWIKPSVKFLSDFLEKENIETIVTSGPPHSLHLIGLHLKKKNPNLNWIADLRDPWTKISYHKELKLTNWAAQKHEKLELEVLQNANTILATSFTDSENFKEIGAKNVEVITNGFEPINLSDRNKNSEFKIVYSGGLEILRNPEIVWKALKEIKNEYSNYPFSLDFYGSLSVDVEESIKSFDLRNQLKNHGYVNHSESLEAIKNADLLLLTNFDNEESKGIIPGKIFEYMATGNPILAIGPQNADVEKILKETNAGEYFTHQNLQSVKKNLINHLTQFYEENSNTNKELNPSILNYTRKNLTQKLSKILLKESK